MTDKYDNQIMNQVNDIIAAMDGEETTDFNNDGKIQVQDQLDQIIKLLEGGGGGSGDSFFFPINGSQERPGSPIHFDKTFVEISNAMENGKCPVLIAFGMFMPLTYYVPELEATFASLGRCDGETQIDATFVTINNNNVVEIRMARISAEFE